MSTLSDGLRQSDRVSFRLPVEVSWTSSDGAAANQIAETMLVSRNGGVLRLPATLLPGDEIQLRRQTEDEFWKVARACIIAEIDKEPGASLYAFRLTEPRADFWDIDFPSLQNAEDALARLLMECSFCQRREVVYLTEPEVKSFEVRKCVARVCQHCASPSIWIEAQSEVRAPQPGSKQPSVEDRVIPRRNRTRVKARVMACIRRRGFAEEIVVCEDLSKGGVSFRSRNQYSESSRVEIAVPFTPGAGAIFVPIKIVSSQHIPAAGIYRHGASYIKPPIDN